MAADLIVGIYAKKDLTNKVATGSSMSFGWYDKSYDYIKKYSKYDTLNTYSNMDYT